MSNEQKLREMLFYSHGCTGKYGDDGEMQCNRTPMIDFKRDPVEEIERKLTVHGMQAFEEQGGWNTVKALQRIAELEAKLREVEAERDRLTGRCAEIAEDERQRWLRDRAELGCAMIRDKIRREFGLSTPVATVIRREGK